MDNETWIREAIQSADVEKRELLVHALSKLAEDGNDVAFAVPVLWTCLDDSHLPIRGFALTALLNQSLHAPDQRLLYRLLEPEVGQKMAGLYISPVSILQNAVLFQLGVDETKPLLPLLIHMLEHPHPPNRESAAVMLWGLVSAHDVQEILPALTRALVSPDPAVRMYAAAILTIHWLRNDAPQHIEPLLEHIDSWIREGATRALLDANAINKDVGSLVVPLARRIAETGSLASWNAIKALETFVSKCRSLALLDVLQAAVEVASQPWFSRSAFSLSDSAKRRWDIFHLVQAIAQRKATFSRQNDGELLAGETIPKPTKPRSGLYQTSGRRTHHG